ncbi:MAG: aminotransferase class III-fold pyridoxal phosphate-dependent enzyme [Oscillospiraceae bacterium]|nr:aminotransferase class III-fold pyridoxal phosphate-dependent enzyme [Oscillospiraceae bacterium]
MEPHFYENMIRKTFIDFYQTKEFEKQPVVMHKAKGVYLWDVEGKRYFDGIGGVFVATLGHGHPRVLEALRKQSEILALAPPLHSVSDVTLKFVERLGQVSPGNLNYIKSFCGGSESIEGALKLVRQYYRQTGRPDKMKVVSNYLSYHGGTFGALSAGGSDRKAKFEPLMGGFVKSFSPKQLRDEFGSWEETCRFSAKLVEKVIVSENPDTVGAVLVEPICNTAGIITPTEEYFHILREICDKYDVMLILDEVLTGFCKTGDMFAAQTFHVVPDILCSGKGLSGGVIPMGAFMAREDIADAFYGEEADQVQFAHGHTYANFPLGDAVATEVINIMEDEHLAERARVLNGRLVERLEGLKKYGVIREVRGKGVLLGVELVADPVTNEPFPADNKLGSALKKTAIQNGLIMRIDPDWFAIAPPLVSTDAEIDELCDLIEKSLTDAIKLVRREANHLPNAK